MAVTTARQKYPGKLQLRRHCHCRCRRRPRFRRRRRRRCHRHHHHRRRRSAVVGSIKWLFPTFSQTSQENSVRCGNEKPSDKLFLSMS